MHRHKCILQCTYTALAYLTKLKLVHGLHAAGHRNAHRQHGTSSSHFLPSCVALGCAQHHLVVQHAVRDAGRDRPRPCTEKYTATSAQRRMYTCTPPYTTATLPSPLARQADRSCNQSASCHYRITFASKCYREGLQRGCSSSMQCRQSVMCAGAVCSVHAGAQGHVQRGPCQTWRSCWPLLWAEFCSGTGC